jgi:hypothetical protein
MSDEVCYVQYRCVTMQRFREENTLISNLDLASNPSNREDLSEYVAHLQLHMALQARNLVPTLSQAAAPTADSREQFLHQTQADFEKYVSRQIV